MITKGMAASNPQDAAELIAVLTKENTKLRSALRRISVLPLTRRGPTKPDPNVRARKLAVIALGGDPSKIKHFNQHSTK